MTDLIDRHRRACAGFSRVAELVELDEWDRPTPCAEWDARALVEHVVGFHEFLLLRPLGVRAARPRSGPALRWTATTTALFGALATPGTLDRATDLPGGGQSSPRRMLAALTTDVLVHTWDLARTIDRSPELDLELCTAALDASGANELRRDSGMFGPAIAVAASADAPTRLVAWYGRDPSWTPHDER